MAGAGDIEPSRWMGRLLETSERANSMPLWRLWIPGSHETGTWALKGESKSALDTVDVIAGNKVVFEALKAVEKIPGVRQAEHAAIANWSRTQSRTTHQQLELGIRYFDLRVLARDGSYWMVHGLYDTSLKEIFDDMKAFLGAPGREHEVVILDFNHLYACDSPSQQEDLAKFIGDSLGPLLASKRSLSPASTLGEIAAGTARVFALFCGADDVVKGHDFLFPQDCINSPWLNKKSVDELLGAASGTWRERRPDDKFYVCQGLITPDAPSVAWGTVKFATLEPIAREATTRVTEWLRALPREPPPAGIDAAIVIADFVETADFPSEVIRRNFV